jgi:urease accessory protein
MAGADHTVWLAWQVVDSAFPIGAFAHSLGLEAAWQYGAVPDSEALATFLHAMIPQAGYATLPLVNAAYSDPDRVEALDDLADAFLLNSVANRASRVQGRTLLATATRIWPTSPLSDMTRRAARICGHVAPLSGAVLRSVGLPRETVQQIVLFSTARSILSAAVRLGIVGSYEAQQLQFACGPYLDEVLHACAFLDETDLAQTFPLIDLMQAGHDRLYSRLFQS